MIGIVPKLHHSWRHSETQNTGYIFLQTTRMFFSTTLLPTQRTLILHNYHTGLQQ